MSGQLSRRAFFWVTAAEASLLAFGCARTDGVVPTTADGEPLEEVAALPPLPPAQPDLENPFLIDRNIAMDTVDDWLGRPDAVYRDMRMIHDPADYEAIGGDSELSITIEGFRITPFPFIGTLQALPVAGAYEGDCLFDVEWDGADVASVQPRYEESMQILEELFPKDKAIFIMCGGAGYAFMMRQLLSYLGWNESRLYNLGGAWDYVGRYPVELVRHEGGETRYMLWRGDIVDFGFEHLTPLRSF
ncbi:hypothetical protein VJ923_11075 [Adlercreutzia sp. R25]|uniref:hypothetical protein n=1 Tax=Adlercreutzia shanghongiae TaxID=3111773 RepID=UPI002DB6509C|nr:hypothetical protein [Adlercreutzia sp. R25]MEC4273699.1 hypothetical protein [Adlercreutzia sp. R25]